MAANAQGENISVQGDQFHHGEGWRTCLFAAQERERWGIN